jgi:hypothetical protein
MDGTILSKEREIIAILYNTQAQGPVLFPVVRVILSDYTVA